MREGRRNVSVAAGRLQFVAAPVVVAVLALVFLSGAVRSRGRQNERTSATPSVSAE